MNKSIFFFIILFLQSIATGASNGQFTLYVEDVEIFGIERIRTADIILSEVTNGLSGYNITISLSNSSVAEIEAIEFPEWASLHQNSSLPSSSVWIKAVDLNDEIKEDATNIVLATIVFKSKMEGSTCIDIAISRLDDDEGYPISVVAQSGILNVTVNHPPNKPSSPYPLNDATNAALTTVLSWQSHDPDGDALTYDVYFGTSPNPPKVAGNITSNSYNPGVLQYSTKYYWQVVAWDEHGAKNSSEIWHFTTEAYTPPNHPPIVIIAYPLNGSTVNGTIIIKGKAWDEDGNETLQKVEIRIDGGEWKDVEGTTPWNYEWNTTKVANGLHKIYARSYDGIDYSNIVSINVNVFNNHKPFIEIKEPENGSIVKGSVIIKGKAWDEDGNETLQKVEIRIDGGEWKDVEGTINWAYMLNTTKLSNGLHTLEARAYDGIDYSKIVSIHIEVKNKKEKGISGFEIIVFLTAIMTVAWIRKNKIK